MRGQKGGEVGAKEGVVRRQKGKCGEEGEVGGGQKGCVGGQKGAESAHRERRVQKCKTGGCKSGGEGQKWE